MKMESASFVDYLAHKLCYIDMCLHVVNFPVVKFPLLWPFNTCCITHTNLTILSSQTFVFINRNVWAIFTTCLQKFCGPPMGCARHTEYNVGKFVFGKCNRKGPFRRPGHRWEITTKDVIGMDVKKKLVSSEGLVNTAINVHVL